MEFFSLDEIATETTEDIYQGGSETDESEDEELLLAAVNRVMEEDKELLSKIADGESLNPTDRKRIKNLEWLIDKKRS